MDFGEAVNVALGVEVKLELEHRGATVTWLARRIGVSRATMFNLFSGSAPWKISYLEDTALALGTSGSVLVARAEDRASSAVSAETQDDYAPAAFETDVEPGQDWDSGYDSA